MQIFTPHFIQGLRLNPSFNIGADPRQINLNPNHDPDKYNQHYFQVVIFEDPKEPPILVYGTKEDLENKYFPEKQQDLNDSRFPTLGAIVKEKFLPSNLLLKAAERPTIRFLLQCRQLSQMMSYTWLDEAPENIKLAKKIFDSYNLIPETHWLQGQELKLIQDNIVLDNKLSQIQKTKEDSLDYFLIKPKYASYSSISLALLLCGQAYYKNQSGKLVRVSEPIFSTYEMIWEYALDLSWDTFYASRVDVSAATGRPQPPYTRVTLGYPPRPHDFASPDGQGKIEKWSTVADDDAELGFYPNDHTSEAWQNQQLNRVEPPYPYLPLSCS